MASKILVSNSRFLAQGGAPKGRVGLLATYRKALIQISKRKQHKEYTGVTDLTPEQKWHQETYNIDRCKFNSGIWGYLFPSHYLKGPDPNQG